MNKWIPAAIGAAVVVALSAGAWYSGLRAEQAFTEELAKVNAGPALKLELGSYDRGWFRSHGTVKVSFSDPSFAGENDGAPVLFEQPFTVVHGPILWDSAFAFRPAAFGIKSVLDAQPDWPQDFKTILADERVRLTAHVGFGGGTSTRLRIAEGDLQLSNGKLDLQRGDMVVDYDPSDKAMSANFAWPGFVFTSEMGELKVEDMGFDWAGTYYSQNVQIGEGSYHINRISAKQGEMEAFVMNAMKITGKQNLDNSGEKVSSAVDMSLDQVNFLGQEMVKNGSLHLELNNLSMAALQKLDQLNQAAMTPEQMETVFADVMALFQHGAELRIDPLKADIQGQPFSLQLVAKLPQQAADAVVDPMQLFAQAEADLNISASPQLIAAWAPAEFAGFADDQGKVVVQLRQGQILVNGQPYTPGSEDSAYSEDETESLDWAEQEVLEAEAAGYETEEAI